MENNGKTPIVPVLPVAPVPPQINEEYKAQEIEQELSFEEAMARLEEIDELLKTGRAPLADSLALFEEGAELLKKCNHLLEQAELKVQTLLPN